MQQQPQFAAAPPQYAPPPPAAIEYKQPETTPWPPPEEQAGRPAWVIGAIAFIGVLAVFGLAYFILGSHGSSPAAKDAAAKQQTTNPLQKYVEVVGVRIVSGKSGQTARFLVVNHSGVELTDLSANVILWASTQHSDEDSVGSFTFHVDSIGSNESKELSAPLKTDKKPSDMPDDWRNITADVQVPAQQ